MSSTRTKSGGRRKKAKSNGQHSKNGRTKQRVSGEFTDGITAENWDKWRKYLCGRTGIGSLDTLMESGKKSPLLWALPADFHQSEAEALIVRLDRLARTPAKPPSSKTSKALKDCVESWLVASSDRVQHNIGALECLAWANALPALAALLELPTWQSLLETLLTVVRDAEPSSGNCPLLAQLLVGELPLTLAYQLPELNECSGLVDLSRDTVSRAITDLTDGEGLPHGKYLDVIRPLFASWTRSRYVGQKTKKNCFNKESEMQYEWLVRQFMRLLRGDGSLIFETTPSKPPKRLLREALKSDGDDADHTIASRLIPRVVVGHDEMRSASLPEPSNYSEWAQLALMRSHWSNKAQQFSVDFSDGLRTELYSQKQVLWSGSCDPKVTIDGTTSEDKLEWTEVCWYSDEEADYLELEATVQKGWKIQRQFCYGRDDGILLMADAILGADEAELKYELTLPLAKGVEFHPARETNEGAIAGEKKFCRVFPLALPEWRSEPSTGTLEQTTDGLRLSMSSTSRAMYAPLFFDIALHRQKGPLTWRRLTVAHALEIESEDQAVGYRVQSRDDQFLIYRSLTAPKNRTLLGQNLSEEFVCARFTTAGVVEELIMIE